MVLDRAVVGHMPRVISAVCSALLRRGGVIKSEVTGALAGARQYFADLPQNGMEVPWKLTFTVPSRRRYCR